MDYELRNKEIAEDENLTVIQKIFKMRGIDEEDLNHYLETTDDDILSPTLIANIKEGASILIKSIKNQKKALMIVDCDVDGYTSAAFLLNYLNRLFPSYVQNNIEYRIHDGKQHGIEPKFAQEAIEGNYGLMICTDSSSNDYEQHKLLHEHNIPILIIDHHEAEYVSPDACVINNQLCDYPTKSLSGVGMVYKFCCYLDTLIGYTFADDFLDLVSIGMTADMMSLKDYETKHLIFKGIQNIRNPFVKEIVRVQDFSISKAGGLSPFTISFYIAPLVNATIRVGTQNEKMLLFESMLDFMGYHEVPSTKRGCKGQMETIVEQACRNCNNIKSRQTKSRDANLEVIEGIIEEKRLYDNKIIAVKIKSSLGIDKNITGLIANILMAKYQHPILLLNETTHNGEKAWEGSGRGYTTSNFDDLRGFLRDSGFVYLAEGHSQALGVGILDKNFVKFINYSNDKLMNCNFTPCYKVDFIWQGNNLRINDILHIAEMNGVWGQDVEQPIVAIERVLVTRKNISLLSPDKNPTIKITLDNGLSFIKFKASQEEFDSLIPNNDYGGTYINVVGACNANEWNGRINPQIEVQDYEVSQVATYLF